LSSVGEQAASDSEEAEKSVEVEILDRDRGVKLGNT